MFSMITPARRSLPVLGKSIKSLLNILLMLWHKRTVLFYLSIVSNNIPMAVATP